MLTQNERDELGKELTLLAVAYGQDFPKERARVFIDALEHYAPATLQQYIHAIKQYTSSNNRMFPTPLAIRAELHSQPDSRAVALELVHKIDRAITKHGWNWEDGYYYENGKYWEGKDGKTYYTFKDAIISEVGEIGWHAVCSRGGWVNVCRSSNEMEEGIYVAQMRDQIQATFELAKRGIDVARIEMPKKNTQLGEGPLRALPMLKLIDPNKEDR